MKHPTIPNSIGGVNEMNWSNDFFRFSQGLFHCLVWHGSLYFNEVLLTQGSATRRELIDFQNMMLMGAEIHQ